MRVAYGVGERVGVAEPSALAASMSGSVGIDVHLKRVVELTRTTIVKGVYERR